MLPTIEECREFLEVINRGRVAANLEPLEYLDFDKAHPGMSDHCLSARNLFVPATPGGRAGGQTAITTPEVATAIGAESYTYGPDQWWWIPSAIRKVTDPFDNREPGLRERMVEAGVVAP